MQTASHTANSLPSYAPQTLRWQAYEYSYQPKTTDWYWALWIIIVAIAATSVLLDNTMLAILMVIAGASLTILSKRPPRIVEFEINEKGVVSHGSLYLHNSLESFWVQQIGEGEPRLLIKSLKTLMPLIVIPLGDVTIDEARQAMLQHVQEEQLSESLTQMILEYLGF
ncbi:MAG: hypothetical protein AAB391_03295 [Patescibacteria group bacterium]